VGPAATAALAASGFDGRRRPETLHLTEIARLVQLMTRPPAVPVL